MKQPLFLSPAERDACAAAFLARHNKAGLAAHAMGLARSYVMRAETYLMTLWARADLKARLQAAGLPVDDQPTVLALTLAGHHDLVELCRAIGHPVAAAGLLADVAFGVLGSDGR